MGRWAFYAIIRPSSVSISMTGHENNTQLPPGYNNYLPKPQPWPVDSQWSWWLGIPGNKANCLSASSLTSWYFSRKRFFLSSYQLNSHICCWSCGVAVAYSKHPLWYDPFGQYISEFYQSWHWEIDFALALMKLRWHCGKARATPLTMRLEKAVKKKKSYDLAAKESRREQVLFLVRAYYL